MSIKITIIGAAGRMGRELIKAVQEKQFELSGAVDKTLIGSDSGEVAGIGKNNIIITDNLEKIIQQSNITVDFTSPEATINNLKLNLKYQVPVVIGTTGLSDAQKKEVEKIAMSIPIVFSPNMSVGVNLLFKLTELAAQVMQDGFDVEIIEAHHRKKKDSPSGTAVRLAEIVAKELKRDVKKDIVYGREGLVGERTDKEIGVLAIRGGDIVGEHTVMFAGIGERVELIHRMSSRYTLAKGAIKAAQWLVNKKQPGLYTMFDVLGF